MSFLDGILGKFSGTTEGGAAAPDQDTLGSLLTSLGAEAKEKGAGLMTATMSLVQDGGGLDSVLDKFRKNGMVEQVESWVGSGPNLGITAEQVQKVFDPATIKEVATRLGVSAEQAGQSLAKLVPEIVNRLTPEGHVPENHRDLIAEGLAKLKSWTA